MLSHRLDFSLPCSSIAYNITIFMVRFYDEEITSHIVWSIIWRSDHVLPCFVNTVLQCFQQVDRLKCSIQMNYRTDDIEIKIHGEESREGRRKLNGSRKLNLPGLQSVKSEQIDSKTFEIVNAGDQLSFRISKQITP